jgi:hypothetical protein
MIHRLQGMEIVERGTQIQRMAMLYTISVLLFKNSVKPIDAMECSFVSGQ